MLIAQHAVEQYVARVKPGLDTDAARRVLEGLRVHAHVLDTAPGWVHEASGRAFFLAIGDDIVLPLAPAHEGAWRATTCLVRGVISIKERRRRQARRKTRRAA